MIKVKNKAILILLLMGIFLLGYLLKNPGSNYFQNTQTESGNKTSEEIQSIKDTLSLKQKVELYKKLIVRVGPEQAQEELLHSGLPFDGETHLLNHTMGDYLYDKYKTQGLVYCKDYFLSSCYHGFVIRAIADGGLDSLTSVMDVCWSKGESVAIQCAHGIGHGFLASEGYKYLIQALEQCDYLSTKSNRFPSFSCYDGVFMENIFAVHEDGKPSPDRWLKQDDPIYPCNEPKIDQKYIRACWSNQPSWMFQLFKGDLKKVADECLKLTNSEHQNTCFDALARQIHPMSKGSAQEAFNLCSLMPQNWVDPCLISVSRAAFSVGDRQIPFQICAGIHPESKDNCYQQLSFIISIYVKDQNERNQACNKIVDKAWVDRCLVN